MRESAKVLASLSSLAARKPVASDTKSIASATSLEVPVGMMPARTSAEVTGPVNIAHTKYTLTRSPLAQNPFNDPSDEEWPMQSDVEESIASPRPMSKFDDVDNAAQETQEDEEPESQQFEELEQEEQEVGNDREGDEKTEHLDSERAP